MKKIQVQLQGGLGNQLFIWAMAHELAQSHGVKVRIVYVRDKYQRLDRLPELAHLLQNCSHSITLHESKTLGLIFRILDKVSGESRTAGTVLSRILGIYSCKTSYEIPSFKRKLPRVLRGYFQATHMVEKNSSILSAELENTLQSYRNTKVTHSALAVHVRRGDTLKISKSWGILSAEYYLKIIKNSKSLVICTDEARELKDFTSKFPKATILTPDDVNIWETLWVLSTSKELVMANSTLSWWAAWIKLNKDKSSVYFPKPWHPSDTETFENLMLTNATYCIADYE
jgi:hypothetical protein